MSLQPLAIRDIHIQSGIFADYQMLIREKVLPYQWQALNDQVADAAKSHCIKNFQIAAGLIEGDHYGMVFQDSDLYKWLEAAAYCIAAFGDEQLIQLADEACELIGQAQQPDGYINTYYTLKEPMGRWSNLQQGHELYCAGHLFEAAAAYYQATGKHSILDVCCRFADYIDQVFGAEPDKLHGYPGHQEVEVGLIKLYKVTGNKKYLNLAKYFIEERGKKPHYFKLEREQDRYRDIFSDPIIKEASYSQSHIPPKQQQKATGHAVRALYMYSAMSELAALCQDDELKTACHTLYDNVTKRQMYITGAVGATATGESFTGDYDLPNDTIYGETCASVALMMFSRRMAELHNDGSYYDTVERALFNRVLGGISLTGTEFFYVSPLTVVPHSCHVNPDLSHVKTVRQKWFDVACCPTNIARTLMNIGEYAFSNSKDILFISIPIAATIKNDLFDCTLQTDYPYSSKVTITAQGSAYTIALRSPSSAPLQTLRINGSEIKIELDRGYAYIRHEGDISLIEAEYELEPRYIACHPDLSENAGKVAVTRGPLIYCAEQADNGNRLSSLYLPQEAAFTECETFANKGTIGLKTKGYGLVYSGDDLYTNHMPVMQERDILLIPYYLWANRGEGEMRVFLNR